MIGNRNDWTEEDYKRAFTDNISKINSLAVQRDSITWGGLTAFMWIWFLFVWTLIIWVIGEIILISVINGRKREWNSINEQIKNLQVNNKILESEYSTKFS